MMKMICPSCGQAYDEGTVFCTACGSKLTAAEPPDPIEAPRQEREQQPEAFSKGAPTAPRPVISYAPDTAAPTTDDTPDIYTAPSGQPFSIPQSTPADVPAPPVQPPPAAPVGAPPDNAPHDYNAASIWADRTAAAEPAPQASGAQQPPPRPGVAPPAAYAPPYAPSLPPTALSLIHI